MILQNAFITPDGYILCSENDEENTHFYERNCKTYYIRGGKGLLINNCDESCTPLFITINSTLAEIKSRLLWKTFGKPVYHRTDEDVPYYQTLQSLSSEHLISLSSNPHISSLHKYVIGLILQERNVVIRHT